MKTINCAIAGLAVVALLAGCGSSSSASKKPIDPNRLTKVECSALKFSEEFLKKYPDAPAACIEAREHNGKRYAKFNAKVYLNSADRTTVTLQSPQGKDLSTFSFRPSANTSVRTAAGDTKFTDLRTGETITFWVSEDRMTASSLPASTEDSWAVLPPLP